MSISLGTRLGSYEILALIGAGGMGQVYRARDLRLGRDLAVKILPPELAIDASRRRRFESEARVVAALNHPNIVAIYDVGSADGLAFIVSELVEGETLRGVLKRGPVPVRKALDIAVQIADGLAAAHSAGIVHRDLKPENIMLTPQGRVKILDFGLAKSIRGAAQDDTTQTIGPSEPGSIVGTVAYMSPEQAAGRGDLDGRSDQFALGLILHEVVSGKKAFEGRTAAELMTAIIREDPAPLPAGLPTPFRWTIQRCLAKEPGQRYAATLDLFLELRQLLEHASEVTPLSESDLDPAKSRKISRLVPAVLASGGIAGFIAAALWLEAPLTPVSYVPFATEAGIQTMPAWSPAGDRIAYSAEVEGVFQIFTRKLNSPSPAQLTLQDASCFRPFWTPDGTRVYYIVSHGEPDFSLWSIGVAGGTAEKVLDGVAQAALSPNGQILAVAAKQPSGDYALMLSSPPGAPPHSLPQGSSSRLRAALNWQMVFQFTKDGKKLGLLGRTGEKIGFLEIPLDGGTPKELLRGHEFEDTNLMFNWLPDGNILWWKDDFTYDHQIVRTDLRSGADRQITSGVSQYRFGALSPDGRTLAVQAGDMGYGVVEVTLNGMPATTVLAADRDEVAPSWAPDGAHFAYVTNRNGLSEIWLRNRKDGSERLIVRSSDFPESRTTDDFLDCAISPDGSRVAYRRSNGPNVAIWVSSLTGDTPVRLHNDPHKVPQRGPSWSPDGNWIAYYSASEGKPAVLKVRVGTNRDPELVTYAADTNPVRWSPRGEWIAWNNGHNLTLTDPEGKQLRVISQSDWLTYGWSKDGNSLWGIALAGNRRLVLSRIDIPSGREEIKGDLGPLPAALDLANYMTFFPYRGFSLNPDGRSFLTSVLRVQGDIWLLPNFDTRIALADRLLRSR